MNVTNNSVNTTCTCSDTTDSVGLVPNKRVDYNFGMVLGVDDFRQEQFHFEWKSKISNLLLHGYGTVCGLKVSIEPTTDGDFELRIEPGFAISPKGEWIWVEKPQCARLGKWVQGSKAGLIPPFLPGPQTVYVRLCYEECETDLVTIAGTACAAQDQTRAASRITESFRAAFSWDAPPQALEDDIRALGELLHRVQAVDGPVSGPEDGGLIELVRDLAGLFGSPPGSPPFGSPPNTGPILLDRLTACDTIRRVLAVWVTEVRPAIGGGRCMPAADSNDCLLLAALHFLADASGTIQGSVEIDESQRPILAPTRLIQELLPCGCCGGEPTISSPPVVPPERSIATLFMRDSTTLWARIHYPTAVNLPDSAVTILVDGNAAPMSATVAPITGVPAADNLFGLALKGGASLTPATMVTVEFDSTKITESGPNPRKLSQVLSDPTSGLAYLDSAGAILSAFLPIGLFNAGGDLGGTYPSPTVVGLQSKPVSTTTPSPGDVLMFHSAAGANPAEWTPAGTYVRTPISKPAYGIVAAGAFSASVVAGAIRPQLSIRGTGAPTTAPTYNGLKASLVTPNSPNNSDILLEFTGYDFRSVLSSRLVYIVKGSIQYFGTELPLPNLCFIAADSTGLIIRLAGTNGRAVALLPFMVEITAFGDLPVGK
jgi:hypothetical protein